MLCRRGGTGTPHLEIDRVFNDLEMEYVTFIKLDEDEFKTIQHEIGIVSASGINVPYLEEMLDKLQDIPRW